MRIAFLFFAEAYQTYHGASVAFELMRRPGVTVDIFYNMPDTARHLERLARAHDILRIKGYAAVSGKPMRLLVQAVGARVRHQYDRMWGADEPRNGQLVVIAEHDRLDAAALRAALAPVTAG